MLVSMYQTSERIFLTLWIGSMWAVGYIVAPVLFKLLDKSQAGQVAGELFTVVSYIGIVAAVFLLLASFNAHGLALRRWQNGVLLLMLLLIVVGEFVLQPMMAELKLQGLQGEAATRFGRLHGIASVLYLINSLAGLALVVAGVNDRRQD